LLENAFELKPLTSKMCPSLLELKWSISKLIIQNYSGRRIFIHLGLNQSYISTLNSFASWVSGSWIFCQTKRGLLFRQEPKVGKQGYGMTEILKYCTGTKLPMSFPPSFVTH